MPTFPLEKLAAAAVAALAALFAGATMWVTSFAATPPTSLIRHDEFSAPAAGRPQPIEVVLGPQSSRGLRQVPCAGAVATATCYVATR